MIPTLPQLYNSILADLQAEFGANISTIGQSFLRGMAGVLAGVLWLLYLTLSKVQKNVAPDLADPQENGGTLDRWGRLYLGRDRFPARQGQYTALVSGTVGSIIPAQTTFKSNDDSLNPGKLFIIDNPFTLDGTNIITIRALESGTDSQLLIADGLTATGPMGLIDSLIIIQSETIEPENAEDIEVYRQKIIDSMRLEPQGGSASDYRLWSAEVQGVIQSYPYAASGQTSEVNLFIEADTPTGVPSGSTLDDVRDAIELPTADRPARKPLTAIVNYLPVTPRVIDITIFGFVGNNADITALILAAMTESLSEIRPFVDSIDVVADRNDYFDINTIVSIILTARPGSVFGAVTMNIDSVPTPSITFSNGDIPSLNMISYAP